MKRFILAVCLLVPSAFAATTVPGNMAVKGDIVMETPMEAGLPTVTPINDDDGVLTGTLVRSYRITGHTARDKRIVASPFVTITNAFGGGTDAVRVSWDHVFGVEEYIVEYSANESTWTNWVAINVTTNSFVDTGAITWNGTTVATTYPTQVLGGRILFPDPLNSGVKGGYLWTQNFTIGSTNQQLATRFFIDVDYFDASGSSGVSKAKFNLYPSASRGEDPDNDTIISIESNQVTFGARLLPATPHFDIGSAARPWRDLFFWGGTNGIYMGGNKTLSKTDDSDQFTIHTNTTVAGNLSFNKLVMQQANYDPSVDTNAVGLVTNVNLVGISNFRDLQKAANPTVVAKASYTNLTVSTLPGEVTLQFFYDSLGAYANSAGTLHVYAYQDKWMFGGEITGFLQIPIAGGGEDALYTNPTYSMALPSSAIGRDTYWFVYFDPAAGSDGQFNAIDGLTETLTEPATYGENMPLRVADADTAAYVAFHLVDDRGHVPRHGLPSAVLFPAVAEAKDVYRLVYDISSGKVLTERPYPITANKRDFWADWDYAYGMAYSTDIPPATTLTDPSAGVFNQRSTDHGGIYQLAVYKDTAKTTNLIVQGTYIIAPGRWTLGGVPTLQSPVAELYPIFDDFPEIEFAVSGNSDESWPGIMIQVSNVTDGVVIYDFRGPSETHHADDGYTYHHMSPRRTSTTIFNAFAFPTGPPTSIDSGDVLAWRAQFYRGFVGSDAGGWPGFDSDHSGYTAWSSFTVTNATPTEVPVDSRYPADGAQGISVDPTLAWDSTDQVVLYRLHFGTVSNALTASGFAPILSQTISGLETNTTYYWQVGALNSATGAETLNDVWSFTTTTGYGVDPTYGNLTIAGNLGVTGTVSVMGAVDFNDDLTVLGNLGVTGTVSVLGAATFNGGIASAKTTMSGDVRFINNTLGTRGGVNWPERIVVGYTNAAVTQLYISPLPVGGTTGVTEVQFKMVPTTTAGSPNDDIVMVLSNSQVTVNGNFVPYQNWWDLGSSNTVTWGDSWLNGDTYYYFAPTDGYRMQALRPQLLTGATNSALYTPGYIGDELVWAGASNWIWRAFGTTTNDWVKTFP